MSIRQSYCKEKCISEALNHLRSTKSSKDNGKTTKYRKNHFSVSLQVVKSRKPIPNAEPEDTAKMSAESRSGGDQTHKKRRPRLLVAADSHGKNLTHLLQDQLK